jgi:tetratricopeptide (TPR) repeat protein
MGCHAITKESESDEKDRDLRIEKYFNQGNAWYMKDDFDNAIAEYDKVLKLKSRHADAYNNRGNAWARKGDFTTEQTLGITRVISSWP